MSDSIKDATSKLNGELELKQLQLSSLLEITQAINQNFSAHQLFSIYKFVLRTQLKIRKMALFVADSIWSTPMSYGVPAETEDLDVHKYMIHLKDITFVDGAFPEIFQQFNTIIPVVHKNKPLAFALIGDVSVTDNQLKNDLIPFVQTLTNIIVVAIENKKFAREQIRQEGIKIELELAAQMQNMLIPETLPSDKDLEMHATYIPHQEIGGDYYDCIRINNDELIFCMSDVSGKGIPAALLMSNFQANLHALVRTTHSLVELVHELNSKVIASAKNEKFITLFIGKYNRITRELSFINAGHNPPVLVDAEETMYLKDGTTGLGMLDELVFVHEGRVVLKPNTVFLSYTDGVVETENEEGDPYGMDRLATFCRKHYKAKSMAEYNNALINQLTAFKGKNKFADDVTLMVCRFN